jgi:hypothetical protein
MKNIPQFVPMQGLRKDPVIDRVFGSCYSTDIAKHQGASNEQGNFEHLW